LRAVNRYKTKGTRVIHSSKPIGTHEATPAEAEAPRSHPSEPAKPEASKNPFEEFQQKAEPSMQKGLESLPNRGEQFTGELEKYRDTSFGNLSPMERIASHLSPGDLGNALQASKGWNAKFQQTGRNFMDPLYENPDKNLPELLGKKSEPSEKADLAYKMAGLDPQTELRTSLGMGSTQGKEFADGGGFFAKHVKPGKRGPRLRQNIKKQSPIGRPGENRDSRPHRTHPNKRRPKSRANPGMLLSTTRAAAFTPPRFLPAKPWRRIL
jgi:hypothetical protein